MDNYKIIICDNDISSSNKMKDMLKEINPKSLIKSFRASLDALEYIKVIEANIAFINVEINDYSAFELAQRLKQKIANLNIIFIANNASYMLEAIKIHASGYIMKPLLIDDIKKELDNLLYPIKEIQEFYVQTFGLFEVFINDKPLKFKSTKAKEMLAYLIDKEGASVNRKDIASALFLDQPYSLKVQDYLSKIYKALMQTLKEIGKEDIINYSFNSYSVDKDKIKCDLFDYRQGNPKAIKKYHGDYMSQYEWAEYKNI